MGGNISSVVSKCKSKKSQEDLKTKDIEKKIDMNIDAISEAFFKYEDPNKVKSSLKGILKSNLIETN